MNKFKRGVNAFIQFTLKSPPSDYFTMKINSTISAILVMFLKIDDLRPFLAEEFVEALFE